MKKRLATFTISGKIQVPCNDTDEAKSVASQVGIKLQSSPDRILEANPDILAAGISVSTRPNEFPMNERCVERLNTQQTMPLGTVVGTMDLSQPIHREPLATAEEIAQKILDTPLSKMPPGVVSITRGGRGRKKKPDDTAAPN